MDLAIKEENIPSGGIADFIYTDDEISCLNKKKHKISTVKMVLLVLMKSVERWQTMVAGDDTVAHVETGELPCHGP